MENEVRTEAERAEYWVRKKESQSKSSEEDERVSDVEPVVS